MPKPVPIGLLGYGNIGREVYAYFAKERDAARIVCIARRRPDAAAPAAVAKLMTKDGASLIADSGPRIVVELTGDAQAGARYILRAIENGKHVVTANKSALSANWARVMASAREHGVSIGLEATVGGGMPVVRAVQRHVASDDVESFAGILNGTCNFILSQMKDYILRHLNDADVQKQSLPLEQALAEAQRLGYAEPDPTFDVNGFDTKFKVAILANLAFETAVDPGTIYCEGILQPGQRIMPSDLYFLHHPRYLGGQFELKLVGVAQLVNGKPALRVHPALIDTSGDLADLAAVTGSYNGIVIRGRRLGSQFIKGLGAGPKPTTISIASDVREIAQAIQQGGAGPTPPVVRRSGALADVDQVRTRGYIRSFSPDRRGIYAKKLDVLAKHDVSVQSVVNVKEFVYGRQRLQPDYIEIDTSRDGNVRAVLRDFARLPGIRDAMYFRVLELS
jgi:homoserine dehydrogenase